MERERFGAQMLQINCVARHHSVHPPWQAGAMVSWKVRNPPDRGKVPTLWAFLRPVVQANPELDDPANSNILMGTLIEN